MTRSVAVIGTTGITRNHAACWRAMDETDLVACADLDADRAAEYAEEFDIPASHVYGEYGEMVADHEPDIVSVGTPEPTHDDIVIDLARTNVPEAIHCEKAMCDTWGGSLRMAHACESRGIQLTFNHQRRFGDPWLDAKEHIEDGTIGDLQRMEYGFADLFTYGTHMIDLFGFWNDERPADWVLGQVDYPGEKTFHGVHQESQAFATWEYDDGVFGVASTDPGMGFVGSYQRVLGSDGEMRIERLGKVQDEGVLSGARFALEVRPAGREEWDRTEYERTGDWERTFRSVVDALDGDRRPSLGAHNALKTTEIMFGVYESARRRGRVDLPLDTFDHPLDDLVERGELPPE